MTDIETNSSSFGGEKLTRKEAMIEGNLVELSLPEVIQFIHHTEQSGVLRIESQDTAVFGFYKGNLVNGRLTSFPKLGQFLISKGLIDQSTLDWALHVQVQSPEQLSIGEWLIKFGSVTEALLTKALSEVTRNAIREVADWPEGSFSFHVGHPPGFYSPNLDSDPLILDQLVSSVGVLLGLAKDRDENRRKIEQ